MQNWSVFFVMQPPGAGILTPPGCVAVGVNRNQSACPESGFAFVTRNRYSISALAPSSSIPADLTPNNS